VVEAWHRFQADVVPGLALGERELIVRETRLYAHPSTGSPVAVERLARPGLPLGQLRPGRFQPHPALAAALRAGQAADAVCWEAGQPELAAYLRGETVASPGDDGWVLVCFRQWGLGWGRRSSGVLKNFLPPALRDRRRRGGSGGNDRRR
jgi:NOL1/NOP2/fmu family ribosome biogenesis protein